MNILRLISGLIMRFVESCRSKCIAQKSPNRPRDPYRHGWYSRKSDEALGHYLCRAAKARGRFFRTVKVTNVTKSAAGGLTGWPDAMYVGEVVPPAEGGIVVMCVGTPAL